MNETEQATLYECVCSTDTILSILGFIIPLLISEILGGCVPQTPYSWMYPTASGIANFTTF